MFLLKVKTYIAILLLCLPLLPFAQQNEIDPAYTASDTLKMPAFFSLEPAKELHKGRLWVGTGAGIAVYSGISIALWNAWYKGFPLSGFHTFNDWGEWNQMDKAGHFFSAYIESNYTFKGAIWTGMNRRSAMWTAIGVGTGIQATIEIMDGFSKEWGFSVGDIGFNSLGVSFFAAQELLWQEQRIIMKASGIRPDYSKQALHSTDSQQTTTIDERAAGLYGTSFFHVILKDYNALTVWSSANIGSFLQQNGSSNFPSWLNLAIGYGADNIYGGFDNTWEEDGSRFELDPTTYPRYRQFYLSPDIDFTRIPTRHRWLKFTLGLFNWLKVPAPALEINTLGKIRFHLLHW